MNFPPKGIVAIFPFGIPLANVLTLLHSSLPLQAAQIWIKKGVKPGTLECVAQTIACGVLFLLSQIKEYTTADAQFKNLSKELELQWIFELKKFIGEHIIFFFVFGLAFRKMFNR